MCFACFAKKNLEKFRLFRFVSHRLFRFNSKWNETYDYFAKFRFVVCFVSLRFASVFSLHLELKRNIRPCFVVSLRNLFRFALFRFKFVSFRFESKRNTRLFCSVSFATCIFIYIFIHTMHTVHMHLRSCTWTYMVMNVNGHERKWSWMNMVMKIHGYKRTWSWTSMVMNVHGHECPWSWMSMVMNVHGH